MIASPSKTKRAPARRPTVLVSSTVYGYEELLERIYTRLTEFGYDVWMSHKGTMPVSSNVSNFENCLRAVEKCDLFLGVITPNYGSGQDKKVKHGISIFHQEIRKAISLNKLRWLLVHDHVVLARTLLRGLGYKSKNERAKLAPQFEKTPVLEDLRVLDLYEEAIKHDTPLSERRGNWVQPFRTNDDANVFVISQFHRYQEAEAFINENFANAAKGGNP